MPGKAHQLVEDAERVPQPAVGLLGNGVRGLRLGLIPSFSAILPDGRDVRHADPAEVEHLATAQDGGQDLVFLRGGQDEDGIGGGSSSVFRKALNAEAESMCTSSMMYTFLLPTWGDLHLEDQVADVVDAVVAGGVQPKMLRSCPPRTSGRGRTPRRPPGPLPGSRS